MLEYFLKIRIIDVLKSNQLESVMGDEC